MDFIWKFNRSFCLLQYIHRISHIPLTTLRAWALGAEHSLVVIATKNGLYVDISSFILILQIHVDAYTLRHIKAICLPQDKKRKLTSAEKQYVAQLQNYKCDECKTQLSVYEVDHIEQHCCRGNDNISNLVALCPTCHSMKTAREKNCFDAFFEKPLKPKGDYVEDLLN